jgi:hypothetical protein
MKFKELEIGEFYVSKKTGEIGRCVDHPMVSSYFPVLDFPSYKGYVSYGGINGIPKNCYTSNQLRKATRAEIISFLN